MRHDWFQKDIKLGEHQQIEKRSKSSHEIVDVDEIQESVKCNLENKRTEQVELWSEIRIVKLRLW